MEHHTRADTYMQPSQHPYRIAGFLGRTASSPERIEVLNRFWYFQHYILFGFRVLICCQKQLARPRED